jgi:hypothetical protein
MAALSALDWSFEKPEDMPAETRKLVPGIVSTLRWKAAPSANARAAMPAPG